HFREPPPPNEERVMSQPEDPQGMLLQLWEEHVRHEFATHDTEATLATMVADAYVNHIPVLTGGRGRDELQEFYARRFIPQMPPDTEMTPISRTMAPIHWSTRWCSGFLRTFG